MVEARARKVERFDLKIRSILAPGDFQQPLADLDGGQSLATEGRVQQQAGESWEQLRIQARLAGQLAGAATDVTDLGSRVTAACEHRLAERDV